MTIVAAYMPGWKSPCEPQCVSTWGTAPWVNTPNLNWMGDHPERHPNYGAVNEDDQAIIDSHLEGAAIAKIDVFAVNWFRGWACEYGIQRILASTSASPVKAFVQWSNHYDSMSASSSTKPFLYEGIRLAALYMVNAPRYWTRAGRPVLALFSSQHLDDVIRYTNGRPASYVPTTAERSALVADIRNVVGNVLSGDTSGGIVGSTVAPSANPGPFLVVYDTTWGPVVGVDAMTYYSQHNIVINPGAPNQLVRCAHSYDEIMTGCSQVWGTGASRVAPWGKEFWPIAQASGWGRQPWGGTLGDPLADNCKPTKAQFRQHCLDVKAQMQLATSGGVGFFYAWNEPGESHPINPTPEMGNMYINVMSQVFA